MGYFQRLSHIEQDEKYYIDNNYRISSIKGCLEDIQKAKVLLAEYEQRLMVRYQEATRLVGYTKVLMERYIDEYKTKRVFVRVKVITDYKLDNNVIYNDLAYGYTKEFSYQDRTEALLYVYDMLKKFPGSIYHNHTPYKDMEI